MPAERMTRINPDGVTYRVPFRLAGEFRIMSDRYNQAIFGDIVDRLGEYESCLSLAEAKRYRDEKNSA